MAQNKTNPNFFNHIPMLTHWGRVTHMCVSKITIIGSDNGLSPGGRQAIIWTSVAILLIGPLGTNFSEILIKTYTFSFKKMHLKMSSGKWRPFCLSLNVLTGLPGMTCWSGVGGTKALFVNFSVTIGTCKSTGYILWITFMFERCDLSWAVVTPVKYEHDIQ